MYTRVVRTSVHYDTAINSTVVWVHNYCARTGVYYYRTKRMRTRWSRLKYNGAINNFGGTVNYANICVRTGRVKYTLQNYYHSEYLILLYVFILILIFIASRSA